MSTKIHSKGLNKRSLLLLCHLLVVMALVLASCGGEATPTTAPAASGDATATTAPAASGDATATTAPAAGGDATATTAPAAGGDATATTATTGGTGSALAMTDPQDDIPTKFAEAPMLA